MKLSLGIYAAMINAAARSMRTSCAILCLPILLLACDDENNRLPLNLTGVVFDSSTFEPLEGVYVIAFYTKARGTPGGHSSSYCYMTKGMYTGRDGRYSLPVIGIDYGSPGMVAAIKPDYYHVRTTISRLDVKKNAKAYFSDWNIYMMPQSASNPTFKYSMGEDYCYEVETREKAAAWVEYLEIKEKEYKKYPERSVVVKDIENRIEKLSKLPTEANVDSSKVK